MTGSPRQQRVGSLRTGLAGLILGTMLAGTGPLWAGLGPHNVLLVVNEASWASRAIANEFAELRQIPPENVLALEGVPVTHQITVEEFRRLILRPIVQAIVEREIEPQIECIAYSVDFPWKIDLRGDLPEGSPPPPPQLAPYGSLTGMTYLFELTIQQDPSYLRLDANAYARRRAGANDVPRFNETEQRAVRSALAQMKEQQWEPAATLFGALLEQRPRSPALWFHHAACLSRLDRTEEALDALEQAVTHGWMPDHVLSLDQDHFRELRAQPRYKNLVEKLRASVFDVEPAESFSHARPFALSLRTEPVHYLLSVMLGVTAGRGNSVAEVQQGLRRSAAADFRHPPSTFYFPRNSNIRSTTREPYFAAAVEQIKQEGRHAEIVDGTLPRGRRDIGGLMTGTASFDWSAANSVLQPGAICEHLTSFGAMFQHTASQMPISEWIRRGAAGTSGTVHEPYAIQAKFPTAFLHVHYARGFSLAESFYLSVAAPYQLLIVGDPLCQPWAFPPEFSLDFPDTPTFSRAIPLEPVSEDPIHRYQLLFDGKLFAAPLPGVREFLPVERHADGPHTLSVVALAENPARTQQVRHFPFRIDRFGKQVELRLVGGPPDEPRQFDSELTLHARCTGAERIEIRHHGRVLGNIQGESGTLSLPAERLGIGRSQIVAIASAESWSARGETLTVRVEPPPRRTASEDPPGTQPGLRLSFGDAETALVESLDDINWLSAAGVAGGQDFVLRGSYLAEQDDLYQLEVEGNLDCQISINGIGVPLPSLQRAFRAVPLSLARGIHHFEVRGTATENPRLRIRFGNRGRRPLDRQRFSH
jgi:hypothetical protein